MSNAFSKEEKKKYFLNKYIKENIFNFVLDMVLNILFVSLILYFCNGTNYGLGIILAICYSFGKFINDLRIYKKDYIDVDIK